jgi:hypothetical protein
MYRYIATEASDILHMYICKRNRHYRKIAEERDGSLKTISYINEKSKTVLQTIIVLWFALPQLFEFSGDDDFSAI